MKCPFCDSEMEKGYVQANRGMAWTKKIHKFDLVSPNQCHLVNQFQSKIQWFSFKEIHCFFVSKTLKILRKQLTR